jgi:hypothetical protein
MSAPIKREDIRKGDRIRVIEEYTTLCAYTAVADDERTYELIERPVVLPTEPGWYFDRDGDPWEVDDSVTLREQWAPYTRIRPEAEVAAAVLAEVRTLYWTDDPTFWGKFDAIEAKYGVTK